MATQMSVSCGVCVQTGLMMSDRRQRLQRCSVLHWSERQTVCSFTECGGVDVRAVVVCTNNGWPVLVRALQFGFGRDFQTVPCSRYAFGWAVGGDTRHPIVLAAVQTDGLLSAVGNRVTHVVARHPRRVAGAATIRRQLLGTAVGLRLCDAVRWTVRPDTRRVRALAAE